MAKKIAIIGHFGGNETFLDGQTVKTKVLCAEFEKTGITMFIGWIHIIKSIIL